MLDPDADGDGVVDCPAPCAGTPPDQCCDPQDGTLAPIDDGQSCSVDVCHPDGQVTPDPPGPPAQRSTTLRLAKTPSGGAELTWSPDASWAASDVYRGTFASGQPWHYDETCLAADGEGPSFVDDTTPTPGGGLYYLVAGVNECGVGLVGVDPTGQARFATSPCAR